MTELTMAQHALLHDLAVLQDLGLIAAGGVEWVGEGDYDEGTVRIPPTVTEAGRALLSALPAGRTKP